MIRHFKRVLCVAALFVFALPVSAACTAGVSNSNLGSPISGTSFLFTVQINSCPNVGSATWVINDEKQPPVSQAPYSLNWNTFYAYNGTPAIYAILNLTDGTIVTSPTVTFAVANILPQPTSQLSCLTSFPFSPWSGTEIVTVSCSGTNAADNKTFNLLIDGFLAATFTGTATSHALSVDTTKFLDGPHRWVVNVSDNVVGQPSGHPSNFTQVYEEEQSVTFSNGFSPVAQLRADATDVFLNLTSQTTHQLVPTAVHTDASTTTPSATYSVTAGTGICLVSGGGLITALALGTCQVTITSGSLTKIVWVNVLSDLTKFYQFAKDGSILGNWSNNSLGPFNSMLASGIKGLFTGVNGALDPYYSQAQFAADWKAGGWNVIEVAIGGSSPMPLTSDTGGSSGSFATALASYMAQYTTPINAYGLKAHLITDNALKNNTGNALYITTEGPGSSPTFIGSQTAYQYAISRWYNSVPVIGASGPDEVDTTCCPLLGQIKLGTLGFTQIVASAGVCTANLTNVQTINIRDNKFAISGSIFGLNSTPGIVYTISSFPNGNTAIFNCAGVANGTYNSSNEPNLTWQPIADAWFTTNGTPSTNPATAVAFNTYNSFSLLQSQINALSPRPMFAYPPGGVINPGSVASSPYNFLGNWSQMGDYSEVYTTSAVTGTNYRPGAFPLSILGSVVGSTYRSAFGVINQNAPFLCEPTGVPTDYGLQGNFVNVTSFVGNLVTFSAPHGISTVLDGDSRLSLSGQSNSSDNGNYYISDCPTATTCHVYHGAPFTTSSHFGGTVTYQDGSSFGVFNFPAVAAGNVPIVPAITTTVDPTCAVFRKRGQTAIVSATGTPLDGAYYATMVTPVSGSCSSPHNVNLWPLPSGSSTGGTAQIIPDNGYVRGRNIPGPEGNEIGPLYMGAMYNECMVTGANGVRTFFMTHNQDGFDATVGAYNGLATGNNNVFNDTHSSLQLGTHPHYSNAPGNAPNGLSLVSYEAMSYYARLHVRNAKFEFQARQNSPDLGPEFDTSFRSGAIGQFLEIQSLTNGTQTRTIDLTGLNCGHDIIKYYAPLWNLSISTITAGTSSDTLVSEDGAHTEYVCPAGPTAAEYSPIVLKARLADVSNATKILVQFNYSPWLLQNQTTGYVDCGTGTCLIPADRNIGTVFYRRLYLDTNGAILSTSDVESIKGLNQ